MDTGVVVALVFAGVVVFLAIVLTRAFGGRGFRGDINRSGADGRGAATWIGVREAGKDDPTPGD